MNAYKTGMDVLLGENALLQDLKRVGLVAHPASINRFGTRSHTLLHERIGDRLSALFGPEHGFYGVAGPGEAVLSGQHPEWRIPIHSLYGDDRVSLRDKIKGLDAIIFDLQDLSVRCYTYVSTLAQMMEAVSQTGARLIVTDRPTPFMNTVDGPMLDEGSRSFVAAIPAPLVYGMTPGETALWLKDILFPNLDLCVVPFERAGRYASDAVFWRDWIPPSPAIRSLDCARCYPATVFTEAFPFLYCARHTGFAFTVLASEEFNAQQMLELLGKYVLPGCDVLPWTEGRGSAMTGIRLHVHDPALFRPARTSMALLLVLQEMLGKDALWRAPLARPDFFDKLMGGPSTREALLSDASLHDLTHVWETTSAPFFKQRAKHLIYASS